MSPRRTARALPALGQAAQDNLLEALQRGGPQAAGAWRAAEQAREERVEQALRELVTAGLLPLGAKPEAEPESAAAAPAPAQRKARSSRAR